MSLCNCEIRVINTCLPIENEKFYYGGYSWNYPKMGMVDILYSNWDVSSHIFNRVLKFLDYDDRDKSKK